MGKLTHEANGFVLSHIALEVAGAVLSQNPMKAQGTDCRKKGAKLLVLSVHSPSFCRASRVQFGGLDPMTSFDPNCL